MINGVLAISAVQRPDEDRHFQTASINSRFAFTRGKVEVRVALPYDQALKTVILLMPEREQLRGDRVNGEIELVADLQSEERWLYSRLSFNGNFGAQQTYRALTGKVVPVLECPGNGSSGVAENSRFFGNIRAGNGKSHIEISFSSFLHFHKAEMVRKFGSENVYLTLLGRFPGIPGAPNQ